MEFGLGILWLPYIQISQIPPGLGKADFHVSNNVKIIWDFPRICIEKYQVGWIGVWRTLRVLFVCVLFCVNVMGAVVESH
jgi:hypothetical protein